MFRKGEVSTINKIVLAILGFAILVGLVFFVKDGVLSDVVSLLDRETDYAAYEQSCTQLDTDSNDFKKNAEDVFDVSLDYDVDEITYFALYFDGKKMASDWYMEWWKVECDGTDGVKTLMRYSIGQWLRNKMIFAKTENKGYVAGLGCGGDVRVITKTGDRWWAGTDANVRLCYLKERSKRE